MSAYIQPHNDPTERQAWLLNRRQTLGSSDAYRIICGKYGGSFGVYADKKGLDTEEKDKGERVEIGSEIEPFIAHMAAKRYGWTLIKGERLVHPVATWVSASIDYVRTDGAAGPEIVEIKNVDGRDMRAWGMDDEEAGDGTVPDHIRIQVQHQLFVADLNKAWIVALFGGNCLRRYHVTRDEALIAAIVERCRAFWFGHVVAEVAPPVDGSDGCTDGLKSLYPQATRDDVEPLPAEAERLVLEFDAAKADLDAAEARKTAAQQALMAMLGERSAGLAGDRKITWSNVAGRASFDAKRFEADYPDLAAQYTRIGNGYRRFMVSKPRGGK